MHVFLAKIPHILLLMVHANAHKIIILLITKLEFAHSILIVDLQSSMMVLMIVEIAQTFVRLVISLQVIAINAMTLPSKLQTQFLFKILVLSF